MSLGWCHREKNRDPLLRGVIREQDVSGKKRCDGVIVNLTSVILRLIASIVVVVIIIGIIMKVMIIVIEVVSVVRLRQCIRRENEGRTHGS